MEKRKIVYTGSFNFPNRDAAAARVLGNAKAFRELGYEVIFLGIEKSEREEDKDSEGKYFYQGFEYLSINKNSTKKSIFKDYINKGKNVFQWVDRIKNDVHAVVLYNSNSFFTKRAIKFCNNNNINLVLDLTEWYNGNHLPFGKWGPLNWDNQYRMRVLNHKITNIIAISDFLYNYYKKNSNNTIKIPPLVDFDDSKWRIEKDIIRNTSNLRFVYAGTPAKKDIFGRLKEKDFLRDFLQAVYRLKKEKSINVELSVYGIKEKDFFSFYDIKSLGLNSNIVCHGRIQQEQVPQRLCESHYSVLLRPIRKYTKAGFSTKLVESMSSGVPVLTNMGHGDVNRIMKDNETGYLLKTHSVDDIMSGIENLINEESEIHSKRAQKAQNYALNFFDYKNEIKNFAGFLESMKNI